MGGKIVRQNLCKGVDFCGVSKYSYIVRADLACYMRSTNFNKGDNLAIFSLHPNCRGDHYLASKNGLFYIIKGNFYRRVRNMTTDEDAVVYTLHPNCRGGDHYLAAFDYFYIIYQNRCIYRKTKNLNMDEEGEEVTLHPSCNNGLYYFGLADCYYFMKPLDLSGIQYLRSTNFNKNLNSETFSFHPSVINFLPGGLAVTIGLAYGEWVCIQTIINDSETPVVWKKTITRKIGFEREKMASIKKNWKVSTTEEGADLVALIAKSQFSLATDAGGFSVNLETESWNEATEIKEPITVNLQPHQGIYVWTYQLCLGKEPVMYCHHMRIMDDPSPPTSVPLPLLSTRRYSAY